MKEERDSKNYFESGKMIYPPGKNGNGFCGSWDSEYSIENKDQMSRYSQTIVQS